MNKISTQKLSRIGILGAIGFILMFLDFPLGFVAPGFMKVDLADVPALIAGFAMGPTSGVLVQLIKNILNLFKTSTGGVGELSNFIVGSVFVLASSLYYKKNKTMKGAYIGLAIGTIAMSLLAMASNYFFIYPLYARIAIPMETIIAMGQAIFPSIETLWDMMILSVLPFNILKGAINSVVTAFLYKRVRKYL